MSRKIGCGRRPGDEGGVSTVLGAILMFGLLVVTLVMVQTQFAPVWDKQREEDTMLEVAKQVSTLKSDLDRLAGNETATPIADQVSLSKPQGFTFFQASGNQLGTLAFQPATAGAGMTVSSNQLTIQRQNGRDFYGISEEWEGVTGTVTLPDIAGVVHMRLRIVDPSEAVGNMALTITDENGMCAGKIVLTVAVLAGSDNNIEAKIYRANVPPASTCDDSLDPSRPNPITITNSDQKKQLAPPYWYLDAFDPMLQFDSVLAAVDYPAIVSLARSGIEGDYTIVYDEDTGGGTTRVGGGGLVVPNYSASFPHGSLTVEQPNARAPSQLYVMEYGAVILDQPGQGAAMVVPPNFAASTAPTQVTVQWSFAALTGSSNTVKAPGGGTVLASSNGQRTDYEASAPRLQFTIATAYPGLWVEFWDQTLVLAGLTGNVQATGVACTVGGVQYTICSTATTATLVIYGSVTAHASLAEDLYFRFQEAGIAIQLRPAG